jgi:tetratricopeptide (TPR) repeat protein
MVQCAQCQTLNSLDSKFCKACGTALPTDVLDLAVTEFEDLVQQGYDLYQENRTAEALMIAQSAVETNPSSAKAISLKGLCLERLGRMAEALDCYEKVIELKPDSAIDRIKVNQLRAGLAVRAFDEPKQRKRRALIVASASVLGVFALGITITLLVVNNNQAPKIVENTASTASGIPISPPFDAQSVPQPPPVQQQQAPVPENITPPAASINATPGRRLDPPPLLSSNSPGFLPLQGTIEPLRPPGSITVEPISPPTPPQGETLDPPPAPSTNAEMSPVQEEKPKPKPVVDVRPAAGRPQAAPTGSSESGGNELQAVLAAARQNFQTGNLTQAAALYERALNLGADPGSTNQRLGQTYSRLGNRQQAVSAYNRAIAVFEGRLRSGQGDTEAIRAQLEAARQAVKALGG